MSIKHIQRQSCRRWIVLQPICTTQILARTALGCRYIIKDKSLLCCSSSIPPLALWRIHDMRKQVIMDYELELLIHAMNWYLCFNFRCFASQKCLSPLSQLWDKTQSLRVTRITRHTIFMLNNPIWYSLRLSRVKVWSLRGEQPTAYCMLNSDERDMYNAINTVYDCT